MDLLYGQPVIMLDVEHIYYFFLYIPENKPDRHSKIQRKIIITQIGNGKVSTSIFKEVSVPWCTK